MQTILFVCSGNTCRSPMAEAIARHALGEAGLPDSSEVFIASAGVHAIEGIPITPETVRALAERGIPAEGSSKLLTPQMVRQATHVFCMTDGHLRAVQAMMGDSASEKISRLDPEGDLDDPIGMGQSAYDSLSEHLMKLIPLRLKETLVP